MDYDDSPPERIAATIGEEIGRQVEYRDVEDRWGRQGGPSHCRVAQLNKRRTP